MVYDFIQKRPKQFFAVLLILTGAFLIIFITRREKSFSENPIHIVKVVHTKLSSNSVGSSPTKPMGAYGVQPLEDRESSDAITKAASIWKQYNGTVQPTETTNLGQSMAEFGPSSTGTPELDNDVITLTIKEKISDETRIRVGGRFSQRIDRLTEMCQKEEYKSIKPTQGITSLVTRFANRRLDWCHIPKIATTFLTYVNAYFMPFLKEQAIEPLKEKDRKRFFLVREPFSRLVSGFICKIMTNPEFWNRYGKFIISKYRVSPSEESKRCGHDVTFPEFIKFYIWSQTTGQQKNKHFMPIHEQCNICHKKYNYIVHLETLKDDMDYIFDSINVTMDVEIRDTGMEIADKVMEMTSERNNCFFQCKFFKTLWWSFQARGFISVSNVFPLNDVQCESTSVEEFKKIAVEASQTFTDRKEKSKQKRKIMTDLYLQLPLEDRLKVRDILFKDFELFEYDSKPEDIFPMETDANN